MTLYLLKTQDKELIGRSFQNAELRYNLSSGDVRTSCYETVGSITK